MTSFRQTGRSSTSTGMTAFDGAVVALGALGLVVRVTLDVFAEFELRQQVFEWLSWPTVEENLLELLGLGYSTSLFTRWTAAGVDQIWVKSLEPVETVSARSRPTRRAIRSLALIRLTRPSSWAYLGHHQSGFPISGSVSHQAAATNSNPSTRVLRACGRGYAGASAARANPDAAPAHFGDPGGCRGLALAQPVL